MNNKRKKRKKSQRSGGGGVISYHEKEARSLQEAGKSLVLVLKS
jgi:hypothetical protein